MQNVETRRRDRITSDEEERTRLGYDLQTTVRFASRRGELSARPGRLLGTDGSVLAQLTYGHTATLWRMNLGWRRRKDKDRLGFLLDLEKGFWSRKKELDPAPNDVVPEARRPRWVVPYVEDHRNCLIIEPTRSLEIEEMATLQAALKAALQRHFQLEDRELAAEPLPTSSDRRTILLYEAAEGGAGVLERLIDEPDELARVAGLALELAHFGAGEIDMGGPDPDEPCEAACYDCLLSYYNQREHRLIRRRLLPPLLGPWSRARVEASPTALTRREHLDRLLRAAESELERRWLRLLDRRGHRLPTHAQTRIEAADCRPDFAFEDRHTVVFVDGPHHALADQIANDAVVDERLYDLGYDVLRFAHDADWGAALDARADLFGEREVDHGIDQVDTPVLDVTAPGFDPDLFGEEWHPLLRALSSQIVVEPGGDVTGSTGRVIGATFAQLEGPRVVHLVDARAENAEAIVAALRSCEQHALAVHLDAELSQLLAFVKGH